MLLSEWLRPRYRSSTFVFPTVRTLRFVNRLIRQHHCRILQALELHLRVAMRDEYCTCLLERRTASDVIVVMMAVDHVN